MRRWTIGRRGFLRGVGAAAVLTPLSLEAWARRAHAQAPTRTVFVYVPDGCIPELWHPTGSEESFTLPEMSAPLEVVRDDLVFLAGLDMYAGGATHEGGVAKVLTATGDVSLDVFLGQQLRETTPFASVHLGVATNFENGSGSMSFVGAGAPVTADDNPLNAFGRLFGDVGREGDPEAERRRLQRRNVLDVIAGDVSGLSARLGATERDKLELHLASIEEVQRRLVDGVASGCGDFSWNERGFAVSETDYYPKTQHRPEHFQTVGELQMDLATLALACDATRVVSLMWSHPVSPTHLDATGSPLSNHDASHYGEPGSEAAGHFVRMKRWFMERFVYLIDRLAAMPEGEGSLLDNTLVVLCSELGDSNRHDHESVPFVLAGRAGGRLRTGRFLDYRGSHGGENAPHSKLLVSVARAAGVAIDRFGYTGHGEGGLDGLLDA